MHIIFNLGVNGLPLFTQMERRATATPLKNVIYLSVLVYKMNGFNQLIYKLPSFVQAVGQLRVWSFRCWPISDPLSLSDLMVHGQIDPIVYSILKGHNSAHNMEL